MIFYRKGNRGRLRIECTSWVIRVKMNKGFNLYFGISKFYVRGEEFNTYNEGVKLDEF